jgi:serine phosphatase RsbU (regulator of sigma subunit)
MPPLCVGTDTFVLAGMIEPSGDGTGDAFDYALSETAVTVAIFDAMGHALGAALLAAAAVAAYRSARRNGGGLSDQARLIDDAVASCFGVDAFVTGILGELDLNSGQFRYLAAGHPHPRLLRDGKVIKTLTGGRRLPFGLGGAEAPAGTETLQPGDWFVLHTDGVPKSCNEAGVFFGEDRLTDVLEGEAAVAAPAAETVRACCGPWSIISAPNLKMTPPS